MRIASVIPKVGDIFILNFVGASLAVRVASPTGEGYFEF